MLYVIIFIQILIRYNVKISLLHAPDHSILTSKLKNLLTLGGGTPPPPSQTLPPLGRFAPSHLSLFHSVPPPPPPQCVDPRYATGCSHRTGIRAVWSRPVGIIPGGHGAVWQCIRSRNSFINMQ